MRAETDARLRIDGNEGWTLDTARELTPELIELGVEFVEQPFPAADLDSLPRLPRARPTRLPVYIDEGCKDLASVAPIAQYADGIVIKLSKCGGIREALRMIHAARALGLGVMLGCMIESELGISAAAQLGLAGRSHRPRRAPADLLAAVRGSRASTTAGWCSPTAPDLEWSRPMPDRLALFTGGQYAISHAKTAHGILRYGPREVVAVVDDASAGRAANEVVPYARRDVPIVATVAEAAELGANVLVIGVAPFGGALTDEWRVALLEAIDAGMHLEAGLHTVLAEDPEICAAAARAGVELRDLRAAPPGLSVPPDERPDAHVVHTVGSDCAIGKMSVTLELDAAARARGLESAFVATGQTGIAITGWGIAVDHVISDFISGAASQARPRRGGASAAAVRRGPGLRWAIPPIPA